MKRIGLTALFALAASACSSSATLLPTATPVAPIEMPGSALAVVVAHGPSAAADRAPGSASGWIEAAAKSDYLLAGAREETVGVWIDVPDVAPHAHLPTAIALAIDTSGSMDGQKIVQARAAARTVIDELSDGDIVCVLAFNDTARELVRPTVLTPATRASILGTIAELGAGGATNIADALTVGEARLRAAPASHPLRRLMLISDGRATAGSTDRSALANIAEGGQTSGVQVTALGVGLDYDENALNAVAIASSGRLFHLSDPSEMVSIIRRELDLLRATVAVDALVEVVPAPGVRVVGADGQRATWGASGAMRVTLGAIFGGQHRELALRLALDHGTAIEGKRPLVSVRLHFRDPADGGLQRVQEAVVRSEVTTDPTLVAAHQNTSVLALVTTAEAAQMTVAARDQVSAGSFDDADAQLALAQQRFEEAGRLAANAKDKRRMADAARGVSEQRRHVQAAASAAPAARPAMQREAALEANDFAMDAFGF